MENPNSYKKSDLSNIQKSFRYAREYYSEIESDPFLEDDRKKIAGTLGELYVMAELFKRSNHKTKIEKKGNLAGCDLVYYPIKKNHRVRIEVRTSQINNGCINNPSYKKGTRGCGWRIENTKPIEEKADVLVLNCITSHGRFKDSYIIDVKSAKKISMKEPSKRYRRSISKVIHLINQKITHNLFEKNNISKHTRVYAPLKKIKIELKKYKENWGIILDY